MLLQSASRAGEEGGDDVRGVPIERDTGPVVTHGRARAGVARGLLNIAEGNPGIQGGSDEGMSQGVRSDALGDASPPGHPPHDPASGGPSPTPKENRLSTSRQSARIGTTLRRSSGIEGQRFDAAQVRVRPPSFGRAAAVRVQNAAVPDAAALSASCRNRRFAVSECARANERAASPSCRTERSNSREHGVRLGLSFGAQNNVPDPRHRRGRRQLGRDGVDDLLGCSASPARSPSPLLVPRPSPQPSPDSPRAASPAPLLRRQPCTGPSQGGGTGRLLGRRRRRVGPCLQRQG